MTDPEPLAPRDIDADVREVADDLGAEYPETTFSVTSEADVSVWATHQLQVALRELGDNAARHANSPVEFEVTVTDLEVSVHVHDSGPGLPKPEQRVLEAGRETPLDHGSGLGLWLVNWIVTSLGGEVTTTLEAGTTVTIRLPVAVDVRNGNRRRTAAPFSKSNDE
jgi:signal transduction histidine kinase